MTQAVTVRRDGDTFQARLFWLKAAKLLDPESAIVRVGFEVGPKSFDDIWVEYDPKRSPQDQEGVPLLREHIQCKWHGTPDNYGYAQLIDPEFINANARSLLQRARQAQVGFAPDGLGVRFKLVTNWRIDRNDPLRAMVGNRANALRLDRLFATPSDTSKAGLLRKAWRDHLEIDDTELRILARTLAFGDFADSLVELRDRLDELFAYVGLQRVPANDSVFPYDDRIFQWMGQGRLEFDRTSFRKACDQEGLLSTGGKKPMVFGVKSFEHPIDRLEDRCTQVLDLVPEFEERYIHNDDDWSRKLYPALKEFLIGAAGGNERLRLILDAHATLAFAAGAVLNIKSGRDIELEQRTTLRKIWSPDDAVPEAGWPEFEFETIALGTGRTELAVAIGLTHYIAGDVRQYVEANLPDVGTILIAKLSSGPGARSVLNGAHAFQLAETLAAQIKTMRSAPSNITHLFAAAPNAFTFFFGQRQMIMGPVTLYEFDFDGQLSGSYSPALSLPVKTN